MNARLDVLAAAIATALALVSVATTAAAQSQPASESAASTHSATLDSATAARRAFSEAAKLAATNLHEALPALLRAARAWPTQPSYWASTARVAARINDTAAVRESMTALSSMGMGAATLRDSAVWRIANSPTFAALRDEWQRRVAPIAASRSVVTLADTTLFAEGVDADPVSGVLYVASIRHRTIYEILPNGAVRDLHVSRAPRIGALLGVRVAPDRQSLYATTAGLKTMSGYTSADSSIGALLRIRIADGTIEQRWDVPADSALHLLGDLAIDEQGTVYTSDSFSPTLYRVRRGENTLTAFSHPLFRSLQGIAAIAQTNAIVVADYSHGLLHIELPASSKQSPRVTRIADASGTTSLGLDGILWHNGSIIAVQNGVEPARIMRYTLDSIGQRITRADIIDRRPDIADEPTIGTLWRGGFVYVANSQWEKFDDDGRRRVGTSLRATQLLCVPLTAPAPSHSANRAYAADTATGEATAASTGRNGTRNTDSAPPLSRSCNVSDASSP